MMKMQSSDKGKKYTVIFTRFGIKALRPRPPALQPSDFGNHRYIVKILLQCLTSKQLPYSYHTNLNFPQIENPSSPAKDFATIQSPRLNYSRKLPRISQQPSVNDYKLKLG